MTSVSTVAEITRVCKWKLPLNILLFLPIQNNCPFRNLRQSLFHFLATPRLSLIFVLSWLQSPTAFLVPFCFSSYGSQSKYSIVQSLRPNLGFVLNGRLHLSFLDSQLFFLLNLFITSRLFISYSLLGVGLLSHLTVLSKFSVAWGKMFCNIQHFWLWNSRLLPWPNPLQLSS